ncbi:protein PIN-LIKES 3 isoform X1 [Ziziphus jujuba]|uniref:Protein PIN-LIKES 3 isoform X1 n=4 Tax=Ziziphus jujuba TaxID=326968 RepID=A0A6P6G5B5_ZIZJJ|nr:protein PIN-LIKES 3 isoform X1 [Ziziphus jujuba]XP_024928906.3 protein PIN-LIKES 3 isoform X1 [Ziziphus jujuba]
MELFRLFITASIPVLKVLLVTALGSYLALDRVNILGAETRKHLNTIVFYVFNPALVSSNLAKTITYDSMVKLWFMPVNILITFIIGSILGWIVIQFTRPPTHLRGLILGCCAAGNLGNLLLIIIPAVCKEKGSPFGNSGACYTYGLAYASLSMAIGAIYLWSYVYNIVRISSRSSKDTGGKDFSISKSSRESSISDLGNRTEPLLSSKEFGVTEDDIDHYALPRTLSEGKAEVAVADHLGIKQRFAMLFKKLNLKSLFAPSTIGALVGFAIGIVPQIRKSLIGDEAPLRVIQDTASLLGEGAIPTLTLIIGGNLLKGLKGSGMQKSIILGIVLARYIALPLTGMLIVKGAIRLGFVHSDPLYQFVLLLQFALPPAMNIGTITQLFGAGESECSVIMLWTYALASISLTFWSTFFMWLVV